MVNRTGRILGGLVIVAAGGVLLADRLGANFPDWLFTWPALLVVIGLFIGAKHLFRGFGWWVPVLIGAGFLVADYYPAVNLKPFILPALLILAGVAMMFSRERKWNKRCRNHRFSHPGNPDWHRQGVATHPTDDEKKSAFLSTDDYLDLTAVFGGIKKQLISKDFKGGEVNCVLAGAEINLSQADINGRVVLELNHVLGGSKLTIPANWHLQSELTTVMGGVEDNRNLHNVTPDPNKILVLKGTCFMGGITIMSY